MVILVTSKNEEDPIKIKGARAATIENIETGLGSSVGRVSASRSGGTGRDIPKSLTMVLVAPRLALGFSG